MLTDKQKEVLRKIVGILRENNILFQVNGGLAAIAYGANRPLYDIDLDVRQADIKKVELLFKGHIKKSLHHVTNSHFDVWLLVLSVDGVEVDISQIEESYIINSSSKKVKMNIDLANVTHISINGIDLPIEPKDELIMYKKIIGRDTDLKDIELIERM